MLFRLHLAHSNTSCNLIKDWILMLLTGGKKKGGNKVNVIPKIMPKGKRVTLSSKLLHILIFQ